MKLYYHKTDGGAEYLMDTFIAYTHEGKEYREGTVTKDTQYLIRIDGDIRKDAEVIACAIIEQESEKLHICPETGAVLKHCPKCGRE